MKFRLIFPLIALTAAILACHTHFLLFGKKNEVLRHHHHEPGGQPAFRHRNFNLDVTYKVFWIPDKTIPAIDCIYTAPDGTTGRSAALICSGTSEAGR